MSAHYVRIVAPTRLAGAGRFWMAGAAGFTSRVERAGVYGPEESPSGAYVLRPLADFAHELRRVRAQAARDLADAERLLGMIAAEGR